MMAMPLMCHGWLPQGAAMHRLSPEPNWLREKREYSDMQHFGGTGKIQRNA
jgi:hypothetical protein